MAYEVSDDRSRVDVGAAWAFLSTEAYWARWRSREDFERQVAGAWRLVGCYDEDGAMVGFCRAFSDGVALAYLADVYVLPAHRGAGLGRRMVRVMVEDGPGRDFRWLLHTADAHALYAGFGFAAPDATLMERPHATARRAETAADLAPSGKSSSSGLREPQLPGSRRSAGRPPRGGPGTSG